jgi:uncharacterized protein YbjT (DUF2867 family)
MPLIAASDIGERAADLLTTRNWPKSRVVELHGGSFLTLSEATEILGRAIGQKVAHQSVPEADARAAMMANGLTASFVDAVLETAASFNRGDRWALEVPSPGNSTPTSFEVWAERALGGQLQVVSA